MTATALLEQPWEALGLDEQTFLTWVESEGTNGRKLVVQTFVNGYQSHDGDWLADCIILTDWHTGDELARFDDDDDADYDLDRFVVVRRDIAEV